MSKQCLDQVEARCVRAENALALLIGIYRDLSGLAFAAYKDRLETGLGQRMHARHTAVTRPAFEDIQAAIERILELQTGIRETMTAFTARVDRVNELSEQHESLRAKNEQFSSLARQMLREVECVRAEKDCTPI